MVVFGNKNWNPSVIGTTADYIKIRSYDVEHGRAMNAADVLANRNVCMLGATANSELFGTQDAIGQRIRVDRITCEVIGVLGAKGEAGMGMDQDDVVIMPLLAFQRRIAGNRDIPHIFLSVEDGRPTALVKAQISALMRERRQSSPGGEDDFHVRDMQELMETMESTTTTLTALLSAIAAVSLLVGGIGIMNIMLVSVTERTREIGTRLAIGATAKEVLLQFLVESVMAVNAGGGDRCRRRFGWLRICLPDVGHPVRRGARSHRHSVRLLRHHRSHFWILARSKGSQPQPNRCTSS